MKFGPVALKDAEGAILAHSQQIERDGRTARLRKGSVLTREDILSLGATGLKTVTVARLEPGDVHEDAAAARLAAAIAADAAAQNLRLSMASTGRLNLYATKPGICLMDVAAISELNAVDPMISIATVPQWQRVETGQMIATIKIISYAVPDAALMQACALGASALRVQAAVVKSATLIETQTSDEPPGAKGREAISARLDRLGVHLTAPMHVAHRTAALAAALWDAPGDVILILTASATSDPADVAPAALRAAGGRVERFGMPVDPGNLLFLGDLKGRSVIGLPGCARSLALNGADWVLERTLCGQPITSADIAQMGIGGLLKDIPSRPVPRKSIETSD